MGPDRQSGTPRSARARPTSGSSTPVCPRETPGTRSPGAGQPRRSQPWPDAASPTPPRKPPKGCPKPTYLLHQYRTLEGSLRKGDDHLVCCAGCRRECQSILYTIEWHGVADDPPVAFPGRDDVLGDFEDFGGIPHRHGDRQLTAEDGAEVHLDRLLVYGHDAQACAVLGESLHRLDDGGHP